MIESNTVERKAHKAFVKAGEKICDWFLELYKIQHDRTVYFNAFAIAKLCKTKNITLTQFMEVVYRLHYYGAISIVDGIFIDNLQLSKVFLRFTKREGDRFYG